MRRQPTVAEGVLLAGGLLAVAASFLPFAEIGGRTFNAWAAEPFLFPLSTLPALLALVAVLVAGAPLAGARLPARVAGFDPAQLAAAAAVAATLVMVAWLAVGKGGGGLAAGGVLVLAGSAACATGAMAGLLGWWRRPVVPSSGGKPPLRVIRGEGDEEDPPRP